MKLVVTQHQTLEPDTYRVKLIGVEEVQGVYGMQLRFKLEVTDPEAEGARLTAWANASTHATSKAVRYASAFAGEPFRPGDVVDFDRLIGKEAKAVVDVRESPDGRTLNRVNDILPLRRKAPLSMAEVTAIAQAEHANEIPDGDPFADA